MAYGIQVPIAKATSQKIYCRCQGWSTLSPSPFPPLSYSSLRLRPLQTFAKDFDEAKWKEELEKTIVWI